MVQRELSIDLAADERPCACACTIATHAPKKATHAARDRIAIIIRANFLVRIAISFWPVAEFCLSEAQAVTFADPTIIQGFRGGTAL
jgi:hypothetical protein